MVNDILSTINDMLVETEKCANEFLPLKDKLNYIQNNFNNSLSELKQNAENADNIADRVFYTNKYLDLIKRAESIFDMRSKRLQQTVSMLSKLSLDTAINDVISEDADSEENKKKLTPEQANALLKVINDIHQQNN